VIPNTGLDPQSYAWNWFALHSSQRMQLVNFWLVAIAFLGAAFVQARASNLIAVAFGICVAGVFSNVAFLLLDRRTRELIAVAEAALRLGEDAWTAAGEPDAVRLAHRAGTHRSPRTPSYYKVIQGVQALMAALFVIAGIVVLL
jgi:hypothetical protein